MQDLDPTGAPSGAPRSFGRRAVRIVVSLVITGAILGGLLTLFANLPSSTATGSLATRAAVAAVTGLIVIFFVRRMLRALTEPPPPPPQTVDARTSEVVYVCPVCGTRLRLELAATTKAPKHCGEEMEAQLARQ